jgi:hypothetical protein
MSEQWVDAEEDAVDWLVGCGTAEEARGDYDHDVAKQRELDDTQTTLGELK